MNFFVHFLLGALGFAFTFSSVICFELFFFLVLFPFGVCVHVWCKIKSSTVFVFLQITDYSENIFECLLSARHWGYSPK